MYSLPTEAKLDVLKCLNFDQLTSFKLTNFYFYNLINKYEGELCFRMKFKKLSINVNLRELDSYKIIEPKPGFVKYILNDKRKKWQAPKVPVHRSISLLLFDCDRLLNWMKIFSENDGNSLNSFICIERSFDNLLDNEPRYYILKLPTFPKNFEDLAIIRYCLQQLFTCIFENALFDKIVFNPELISLLFNDNKIICPKFHIQNPNIYTSRFVPFCNIWKGTFLFCDHTLKMFKKGHEYGQRHQNQLDILILSQDKQCGHKTEKYLWKFVSNHLTISDCLTIDFSDGDGIYSMNPDLFDIITMSGYELSKIYLRNLKFDLLYYYIVHHITRSEDCSQMVPNISLQYSSSHYLELSERAENIEIKQLNGVKYTKYQLANIHDPKVRFSFCNEHGKGGRILNAKIRKMKE
uniref:F-box domain-containing protein n=1 Tax=Meloidogyne enterolobii TaxID=390850 RepID=A0A6V7TYH2_MELEN|nr:unnamed protein product [Meloidogyne enterolobii]